jgi:hypothetical protein
MPPELRLRSWLEFVPGSIAGILAVATFFWHDSIETWRERFSLTVYTEPRHPGHPVTITIHPPPTAFSD